MLNTAKEIISVCEEKGIRIYDIVIEEENKISHLSEEEIRKNIDEIFEVMETSAKEYLEKEGVSRFAMADGFAKKCFDYANAEFEDKKKQPIVGDFLMKSMAMAFSTSEVNSQMGKIVASPTAGSAGIMPAVCVSAKEYYDLTAEELQNGFLTAIGIGQMIAKYATFAGAEGGCQAECGAAAAMAAAALVEMRGGSVEMCLHAASITLINVLGLVCDPVAGLVQFPCAFRNASGVMNTMMAADLAMAGVKSIVPFDEVVCAMGEVGRSLDKDLRETGLGGIAATKTGRCIRKEFLGE